MTAPLTAKTAGETGEEIRRLNLSLQREYKERYARRNRLYYIDGLLGYLEELNLSNRTAPDYWFLEEVAGLLLEEEEEGSDEVLLEAGPKDERRPVHDFLLKPINRLTIPDYHDILLYVQERLMIVAEEADAEDEPESYYAWHTWYRSA